MSVYAIPKGLQPLGDGGVVLNIEWFDADPTQDRSLPPVLVDQVMLAADVVEAVTSEMVQDAIAARLPAVEAMLEPVAAPVDDVRSMLGTALEGRSVASAVEARREAAEGRGKGKGR